MRSSRVGAVLLAFLAAACGRGESAAPHDLATMPWDSVVAAARGTTVTWRMWRGDPSVNAYVDEWVAPRLREQFGITLRTVEGQGPDIVNQLRLEARSNAPGQADLVWINGETFAALQRDSLLAGPWAHRLPNARFVDSSSAIVIRDFERPLDGFESPWGRVQFALIYDTLRTPNPPRTVAALAEWIRTHPGRFTHDQGFSGTTFHKMLLYSLAGGVGTLQGGFFEATWSAHADTLFAWLEALRPMFWREGKTFPPSVADLHRLFANGEVDFSMSNNQHEVVTKIRQRILPVSARALLLEDGTIANTHYVGIPANAPNPLGAMVVADFLLSPEAQYEKRRPEIWADGTVLGRERLPDEWAARFAALDTMPGALPDSQLARLARPEVAAEYHDRIVAGWRERIRAGAP